MTSGPAMGLPPLIFPGTGVSAASKRSAKTKKRRLGRGGVSVSGDNVKRDFFVLGRPGGDLLSQGLSHSTIGAEEFNGRVRDGIGFRLLARTTRPAKDREYEASSNAQHSSAVRGA